MLDPTQDKEGIPPRIRQKLQRADDLADAVAAMIANHAIDTRSIAADALLRYREPPGSERADIITTLLAEIKQLKG